MGRVTDRLIRVMKLKDDVDEDRDELQDEYDEFEQTDDMINPEPEEEYDDPEEDKPKRKSVLKFRRSSRKKQEDEDEYTGYKEEDTPQDRTVIPIGGPQKESDEVKVIKPQEFNEAQIVAEYLKEGKTTIVNLEGIEIGQAQRIIDFIGGASFAVDGTLKAISNNIFIVAPTNIEVTGDLRDEIVSDDVLSPELSKS
ncbi:MAG: cell division protein SepF [Lachnospiraceae bacterium]|nr:cell division protein SepF [Lachnospiraceae bacterium]